jgi:hypothetical protein
MQELGNEQASMTKIINVKELITPQRNTGKEECIAKVIAGATPQHRKVVTYRNNYTRSQAAQTRPSMPKM